MLYSKDNMGDVSFADYAYFGLYTAERALQGTIGAHFDKEAQTLDDRDRKIFSLNYEYIQAQLRLVSDALFSLRVDAEIALELDTLDSLYRLDSARKALAVPSGDEVL